MFNNSLFNSLKHFKLFIWKETVRKTSYAI